MTNKELDKIIGSVHEAGRRRDFKRIDPIADLQPVDPELEHTMQIGKLTHDYEWKKMIQRNPKEAETSRP